MLKVKKNLLLIACCGLLCGTLVAGGMLSNNSNQMVSASADTYALETDVQNTYDYWLDYGASVRFGSQGNGIRYTFQVRESAYETLMKTYSDVTFGIIIAPEVYDLTIANVFGDSAIYGWAERNEDGTWQEYTDTTKIRIANLQADCLIDKTIEKDGETIDVKQFYGSLINLKPTNITKEFQGVGYVGVRNADTEKYSYTFVGDESNIRSMSYVAQKAIEYDNMLATDHEDKLKPESLSFLQQNYVDAVNTVASNYTVEYYFEQADGSFVIDSNETEVIASTIGASVSATEKSFDGYYFDVNNVGNVKSGTVYANNKLVLKMYYGKGVGFLDTSFSAANLNANGLSATNALDAEQGKVVEIVVNNDSVGAMLEFTSFVPAEDPGYEYYIWNIWSEVAGQIAVRNNSWNYCTYKNVVAGWNEFKVTRAEMTNNNRFQLYVSEQYFSGTPETVTIKLGALRGVNGVQFLDQGIMKADVKIGGGYTVTEEVSLATDGKAYETVLDVVVNNDAMGGMLDFTALVPAEDPGYSYYIWSIWSNVAGQIAVRNNSWSYCTYKNVVAGWNEFKVTRTEMTQNGYFQLYISEQYFNGKPETVNIKLGAFRGVKATQFLDSTISVSDSSIGFGSGVTAVEEIALAADGKTYETTLALTVDNDSNGRMINFTHLVPAEDPGYEYYVWNIWSEVAGKIAVRNNSWSYCTYKNVVAGWNEFKITRAEMTNNNSFQLYISEQYFNGKPATVNIKLGAFRGVNGMSFEDSSISTASVSFNSSLGASDVLELSADGTEYNVVGIQMVVNNDATGANIDFTALGKAQSSEYAYFTLNVWSECNGSFVIRNKSDWSVQSTKTLVAGWNEVKITLAELQGYDECRFLFQEKNFEGAPETVTIILGELQGIVG